MEGQADQRLLLFEETPVGFPVELSGAGVGRAECGLEFGKSEIWRVAVLESHGVQRLGENRWSGG